MQRKVNDIDKPDAQWGEMNFKSHPLGFIITWGFTRWQIPADNFQFIWIHSGVLLLSPRNQQQEEFIAGMAFARLGPMLEK